MHFGINIKRLWKKKTFDIKMQFSLNSVEKNENSARKGVQL